MNFFKEPAVPIFRVEEVRSPLTRILTSPNMWTRVRKKPRLCNSHYEHVPGPRRGRAVWGLRTDKHNLEVSDSKPLKWDLPIIRLLSSVQPRGVMSVYGSPQRPSSHRGSVSRSEHLLQWPSTFVIFLTHSRQTLEQCLKSNKGRFFPHRIQIQHSLNHSIIPRYITWDTESVVK
jgi:hypothetical protein